LGSRGREFVLRQYSRRKFAGQVTGLLEEVGAPLAPMTVPVEVQHAGTTAD
jgi:hypothetical protein